MSPILTLGTLSFSHKAILLWGYRAGVTKPSSACSAQRKICQLLPHTTKVARNWHASLAPGVVMRLCRA